MADTISIPKDQTLELLIVDDDEDLILFMKTLLKRFSINVSTAQNAEEAMSVLNDESSVVDLFIVDYKMPGLSGIELTKHLKHLPKFARTPVIMLTAKKDTESLSEGISAGVFYYLVKPINKKTLYSIINSAIEQIFSQKQFSSELDKFNTGFSIVSKCEFSLSNIEQAEGLASFLCNIFPEPDRVISGLSSLLVNAIEHGNLKVEYKNNTDTFIREDWEKEVRKKLRMPENKNKKVKVSFEKSSDSFEVTIEDEGDGFDWKKHIDIDPSKALDDHGRGIALANKMCFDKLEFNEKGNTVKVKVFITDHDSYWD